MKRLRIYVDPSVFKGCFDEALAPYSRRLFDGVRQGRYTALISTATLDELEASVNLKEVLAGLPETSVERVTPSADVIALRDAYVKAQILGPDSIVDAEHVAQATVSGADVLASWNFKSIVHFNKIRGFGSVNLMNRYRPIEIYSPRVLVGDEGGGDD